MQNHNFSDRGQAAGAATTEVPVSFGPFLLSLLKKKKKLQKTFLSHFSVCIILHKACYAVIV